jgi:hypothetical protein
MFGAGARFAWENYKKPILVHESSSAAALGNLDANDFGGMNLGGNFQLRAIDRLVISLSIDMGMTKHTMFPYTGLTGANADVESTATCFSFGILLGGKFYVMEPKAEKASLYLHIGAGKYFASVKNSAVNKIADQAAAEALDFQTKTISKLAAPIIIQLAIGAEYFLSDAFSIGADILGFRVGISKSNVGQSASAGAWSGEHKLFTFTVYSAITMNFRFEGGGKSNRIEEDDEAAWGMSGSSSGGGEGDTGGAAAGGATNNGWGYGGEQQAAPADNNGWGTTQSEAAPAGGAGGWGAAPADSGTAAPANDGWEAQPSSPAPDSSSNDGGGGGGGAKPRPKKSKPAASTPPPPPGY